MFYSQIILYIAKAIGVSGSLLLAICTHESGLSNAMVLHDGHSPTYGICQIKFETAKMIGFKGRPFDLMNPYININFAAKYLKKQLNRYKGDKCKATAAYNAGTYNPSIIIPGRPKNMEYINKINELLEKDLITCKS